jgi:diguanylate cyclase (GGDEF)-like protein
VNTKSTNSELPADISDKALLGLEKPVGFDLDMLHAIQGRSLHGRIAFSLVGHLIFSFAAIFLVYGTAPLWAVALWGALSMAHIGLTHHNISSSRAWEQGRFSKTVMNKIAAASAFGGMVWSSGFFLLCINGSSTQMLGLWAICFAMMVFSSLIRPALPSASAPLIAVAAIGSAIGLAWNGVYSFAGISIGMGALIITSSLRTARSQILFEIANSVLQEKSETVSLLLREFEDSGADWLWQTDTSRCVTHASPRFAYALVADVAAIEGQPLLKLIAGDAWESGRYPDALHDLADRLKRRESFANLIVPVTINGTRRWWELSASPRYAEDGTFLGFRGVGSDVTEQHESAEKISNLARFDTLTSLPNRLQLTEALGRALMDADKWRRRCGFFMIDLDRFKAVNDTLGHPIGDRLLAQVAKRLKLIMSDNELCGRLGGDEFAVVLKDATDSNYVTKLARNIIENLSRPYEIDQHTLYIGASVGSAVGPTDGRTVELLMRSADLALYRSKEDGGNNHHSYQHKLHANAEERRVLEFELRHALERNQLHLEYQPVVDANNDNSIMGFEALLRWKNPKFGLVSPVKFIPVAEEARLIVAMGSWALQQACLDAMQWPDTTKVAVNISVDQLTSPGFIETVVQALHDSKLPAWRLELEVTESIFLRDGGLAVQVLDRLRKMGIKLSLDDFGTGYSSLGYLRNIRFDTIKVDRSFVQGAAKAKPESIAIIRAVVALADSLNIATTAEGVETEVELAMVQQMGCKKVQGYYFGRPMPYTDTLALFSETDSRNVA